MKRYLERIGFEVTVLTTAAFGALADDAEGDVVRTHDLVSSGLLRRALRRPALSSPGTEMPTERTPPAILNNVVVPDIYALSWVPAAAVVARRMVRDRRIDAILTSSPKDSTALVGLAAPRSTPWIAEFRDGWTFEGTRPAFPTRPQRWLDRQLEALVVRRADTVVTVSEILSDDFNRRLGVNAICIHNGWDSEIEVADQTTVPPRAEGRPVRILYTGTLTGSEGAATDRDPLPLLEGLELFARSHPDDATRVEFVIVARPTARDEALLARFAHLDMIRHLGWAPRPVTLAIQRSADALVVVTGDATASLPMKFIEYLTSGRPILQLGTRGAASGVLAKTGLGVTVPGNDPPAIAEQLRRISRGSFASEHEPPDLREFSYPFLAEQMGAAIEGAIRNRRSDKARQPRLVPGTNRRSRE
jgi:hypothetical protein